MIRVESSGGFRGKSATRREAPKPKGRTGHHRLSGKVLGTFGLEVKGLGLRVKGLGFRV